MSRPPVHGMSGTPTYVSWRSIINRCTHKSMPNYSSYGGRGIRVCPQWQDFQVFLADMGERPVGCTIDRVDNDGDYTPGNCRWATGSQQQKNKRPFTQPKGRTYGERQCIVCGVNFTRMSSRAERCQPHSAEHKRLRWQRKS